MGSHFGHEVIDSTLALYVNDIAAEPSVESLQDVPYGDDERQVLDLRRYEPVRRSTGRASSAI